MCLDHFQPCFLVLGSYASLVFQCLAHVPALFFSVWIIQLCQGYTVGVFLIVFVMDVLLLLYTCGCVFEQMFCHCIHCVFVMDGLSLYTLCDTLKVLARLGVI